MKRIYSFLAVVALALFAGIALPHTTMLTQADEGGSVELASIAVIYSDVGAVAVQGGLAINAPDSMLNIQSALASTGNSNNSLEVSLGLTEQQNLLLYISGNDPNVRASFTAYRSQRIESKVTNLLYRPPVKTVAVYNENYILADRITRLSMRYLG